MKYLFIVYAYIQNMFPQLNRYLNIKNRTGLMIKVKSKGHIKINHEEYLTLSNEAYFNVDFSNKKIKSFNAINCKFINCKFENLCLEQLCFGAGKQRSTFLNCSFDGSKFNATVAGNAKLINCTFRNVEIAEMFCFNLELINCVFSGKVHKVVFNGTPNELKEGSRKRAKNTFHGNDFSKAKMSDVAFRSGIDLFKQVLPVDANHYIFTISDMKMCLIRQKLSETAGTSFAEDLNIRLNSMIRHHESGQKQLFFIKEDIGEEIFEYLKSL